jgi:hypothetical protein
MSAAESIEVEFVGKHYDKAVFPVSFLKQHSEKLTRLRLAQPVVGAPYLVGLCC